MISLYEELEMDFFSEIYDDYDYAILDVMNEGFSYEESIIIINEFLDNLRAKMARNHQINQAHRDTMKKSRLEYKAREAAENAQKAKDNRNNLLQHSRNSTGAPSYQQTKELSKAQRTYEKAQKKADKKQGFFGSFLKRADKRAMKNQTKTNNALQGAMQARQKKIAKFDKKLEKLNSQANNMRRQAVAESYGLTEEELTKAMIQLQLESLNYYDEYYNDLII